MPDIMKILLNFIEVSPKILVVPFFPDTVYILTRFHHSLVVLCMSYLVLE